MFNKEDINKNKLEIIRNIIKKEMLNCVEIVPIYVLIVFIYLLVKDQFGIFINTFNYYLVLSLTVIFLFRFTFLFLFLIFYKGTNKYIDIMLVKAAILYIKVDRKIEGRRK